ncbi:MAG: hypothetical protein HDS33_03105 [Bacteroides sp.]|nr:hypothetical protein [Bacteroides sp.]
MAYFNCIAPKPGSRPHDDDSFPLFHTRKFNQKKAKIQIPPAVAKLYGKADSSFNLQLSTFNRKMTWRRIGIRLSIIFFIFCGFGGEGVRNFAPKKLLITNY